MICDFYLSVGARTLVRADPSLRYICMFVGTLSIQLTTPPPPPPPQALVSCSRKIFVSDFNVDKCHWLGKRTIKIPDNLPPVCLALYVQEKLLPRERERERERERS